MQKLIFVKNFIFISSLAGGTGSGLGTFLIQKIKEKYQK